MKTTISTMPKSINSKKNEQHTNAAQTRENTTKSNFRPLKENSHEAFVSVQQYQSHPELFLGTPGINLRLKDGRCAFLLVPIGNMAFPLEKVEDVLFEGINRDIQIADHWDINTLAKNQDLLDGVRVFSIMRSICEILYTHNNEGIVLHGLKCSNKRLHCILENEEVVAQLVKLSRSQNENPQNPKVQFGTESIDVDYFSHLVESMLEELVSFLFDEGLFCDEDEYDDYVGTVCMACFMVTQLRGMGREDSFEYVSDKVSPIFKEHIESVLKMLTIDKEA